MRVVVDDVVVERLLNAVVDVVDMLVVVAVVTVMEIVVIMDVDVVEVLVVVDVVAPGFTVSVSQELVAPLLFESPKYCAFQ